MPITPNETGHFAANDGVQLHFRIYNAANAKAGVLVQHGFAEHGGRYDNLIEPLLAAGFSVMTFDCRGHGLSGGTRVFIRDFREYTDDLAAAVKTAQSKLPAKLFLFGHSMGGLVSLVFLRGGESGRVAGAQGLTGVILSNPALANKVAVPAWKEMLARGASRLAPGLKVPTGIPPEHVSRDANEVKKYDKDPLNSKVATARWYTEFVRLQTEMQAQPQSVAGIPMLALIGDGDLIIDPEIGLKFFNGVGGDQLTIKTYSGFYHELINEPPADARRVIDDVIAWLNDRV